MATVSDFLLKRLSEWGVNRIYGYPGDGINGIMGALDRASEWMRFVQSRHEELSAFMACAHAKFTGSVGVCLATSGPGAIHLLNGLYDAKLDHQPVLAIVGQQLDAARRRLRAILEALREPIASGVPVVGLEPSCVAVFRDELGNMLPADEDARRLQQQTFTLAEFLVHAGWRPPHRLNGQALVHGHCHQKALIGMDAECELMKRAGIEHQILDSGCCGMAGSFGFEHGHHTVSMAVGERVLLPAVRQAPSGTFIVADGFSCREQIAQATSRRAIHLAELLQLTTSEDPAPAGPLPEQRVTVDHSADVLTGREVAAGLAAAAGIGFATALAWSVSRSNRS